MGQALKNEKRKLDKKKTFNTVKKLAIEKKKIRKEKKLITNGICSIKKYENEKHEIHYILVILFFVLNTKKVYNYYYNKDLNFLRKNIKRRITNKFYTFNNKKL